MDWPPPGVRWYYSDDAVCIAHADCRDVLPLLPKVDLVVSSPQYNVGIAALLIIAVLVVFRKGE